MKSKCREKQRSTGNDTNNDMAKIEIDLNTENVTEVQF